jgi:hypothetical protein
MVLDTNQKTRRPTVMDSEPSHSTTTNITTVVTDGTALDGRATEVYSGKDSQHTTDMMVPTMLLSEDESIHEPILHHPNLVVSSSTFKEPGTFESQRLGSLDGFELELR